MHDHTLLCVSPCREMPVGYCWGTLPSHRCRPAARRPLESRLALAAAADPPDSYHGCHSPLHPATDASRPSSRVPSTPPCHALSPESRVLADRTTIALPLAIMDRDSALSNLASCATRRVRAKLL